MNRRGRAAPVNGARRGAVALLSALCLALASGPAARAAQVPAADAPSIAANALAAALETIRASHDLPALGAALVERDVGVRLAAVAGVRKLGATDRVTLEDRWHLGSCGKAMTATLAGLLIDAGKIERERTVAQALRGELPSKCVPAYRDVTLAQLLTHRAGIGNDPRRDGLQTRLLFAKNLAKARTLAVESALSWEPLHPPGSAFAYSNFGYVIAGRMLERAGGANFEELMHDWLFEPLGMSSVGLGAPGDPKRKQHPDQPWGHSASGEPVEPGVLADNPAAIAPAGTLHMTLHDWGRFVQLHLRSVDGDVAVGPRTLKQATAAWLHTPAAGEDAAYACGWGIAKAPWAGGDGTIWSHDGSNVSNFARVTIAPADGFALLVACNCGDQERWTKAAQEASAALLAAR